MVQTEGCDKDADALQRQDDQRLTHDERTMLGWLARSWRTMALVGGLAAAGGSGVALLAWLANVIDDLGLALSFVAQNTLSWFIFLALIVQVVINRKQWEAMQATLKIERAKTDPRLRVAEVTAEDFKVGKRPFYVVTIANDGLLTATDVRIHMGIEINDQKPMDWINDVVVIIPANGKEHHFIHSSFWLSEEQVDALEMSRDSLRVVGFFEYAPVGRIPFCYKYLPLQGESRPSKIRQFVPCDYTPRLNTTLIVQPGMHQHFAANVEITTRGEVVPAQKEEGNEDDEKGQPN
jgi:hypothetical protein